MAFCAKCGNEIKDGAKFCGKCGWAVPATAVQEAVQVVPIEKHCASCGTVLKDGTKFCPKCGTPVETVPAQQQTAQFVPQQQELQQVFKPAEIQKAQK